MKKTILFSLSLAALLMAGSCQQDRLDPSASGETVTLTVEVPQQQTKAIGDGTSVNTLLYEVWRTATPNDLKLEAGAEKLFKKSATISNGSVTLPLDLLIDQNYTILFWAQVDGTGHFNTDQLKAVKDNASSPANAEDKDAFYGVYTIEDHNTALTGTVTLRRPFAQLNLGSRKGTGSSYGLKMEQSYVKVSDVANTFNVASGTASGSQPIEFSLAAVPSQDLEASENTYDYASMNYFFVPENGASITVDYTIKTNFGDVSNEVLSVPVKQNFRTNLLGNLLTQNAVVTVEIDQNFYKPDENREVINDAVSLKAAIADAKSGDEIILGSDIVLGAPSASQLSTKAAADLNAITIAKGQDIIINLNGHSISYTSTENAAAALILNNGKLTITDGPENEGKISYKYAGTPDTSYGYGNSTIENKGELIITGGTVENTTPAISHASYAINTGAGATLKVTGGKVLNLNGHAVRVVPFASGALNVSIEGGYIEGTRALNIQLPGGSSSKPAPEIKFSMSGGELKSNEDTYNLAIYVYSSGQSAENLSMILSGGVFNGNVALNGAATNTMKENALTVTGGQYNGLYGVFSYADDTVASKVISIQGGEFKTDYSINLYAPNAGFKQGTDGYWTLTNAE